MLHASKVEPTQSRPVRETPLTAREPASADHLGDAGNLEKLDSAHRVRTVLALQRGLGNRATGRVLHRQQITPVGPGGGSGGLIHRDTRTASPQNNGGAAQPDARAGAPSGPELRQGPIGDVIIPLPDRTFLPQRSIRKELEPKPAFGETTLLVVPIPELAVMANISGSAEASATFIASFGPGVLRNVRVGLSYEQAAMIALGVGLPMPLGWNLALSMGLADDVRGLADVDIPAQISLRFGIQGALNAAARAGFFDITRVGAGLQAMAGASADLRYQGRVGLYHERGHTRFRFSQSLDAQLDLVLQLKAFVNAMLLGFNWEKSWTLADHHLGTKWALGAPLSIDYDNGAAFHVGLNEGTLALFSMVRQLLGATPGLQFLNPIAGPGGAGGSGAGSGGAGGPPGGPTAPRGRTAEDPIPMRWFKSPGLYPTQVSLNGEQFFLTEPRPLQVPDGIGFADIRRHADSAGNITIGVNPGSRFYPAVGRVWPRVASGVVRTGTVQAQFRRLLTAHGYGWNSKEADHVRDLQWRGEDSYANLWPLERSHNNAANQILQQHVTYLDDGGNVVTVPLFQTPLNRWFRIAGYS